nr:reverse transcriptase domain-containing protein [Tanacetum cinerariifolium]
MRTRSSSNIPVVSPSNPSTSNLKRRNHRRSKQPFILEESPVDTMADQRTMPELLRALTVGYAEAIAVPSILADQFELKHSLINMMTTDQFFRLEKDNPHDHIRWFNKITSTIKYKDVPNYAIKLMLFPFSLAGAARRWLEKEPSRSIHTWEDLAWDRYKDLFRACPHHGFTELHQLDTFYNALNPADQDSLNAAAGSNLLERHTQDVLTIIENKSKVRNSRNKSVVSQVKSCYANSNSSSEIAKLTHAVNQQTSDVTTAMTTILKQFQATPPLASVKAAEEIGVTCGGVHPYYQCLAIGGNTFPELQNNIQGYVSAATIITIRVISFIVLQLSCPTRRNFKNWQTHLLMKIAQRCQHQLDATLCLEEVRFPELISTRMTIELANQAICTPPGITRDVFVPISRFTFPADFVTVDYENDPRVPFILGRPFIRTVRALIDVHGEEMILYDGDVRLTLNMRHETSSYSNQPQRESINLINIFNNSNEGNVLPETLLDLDSTNDLHPTLYVNPLSGSTTYSSFPNPLLEEFIDELALITFPLKYDDDLQFDIESDLKEIEYLLYHDLIKDIDSNLKDLIDQSNLANLVDIFVDSMPEMFIDEHDPDNSSLLIFDDYDDDFLEVESDTENVYDDHFKPKGEKIKESKLLIDELDLTCDFLPLSEYDTFPSEDFSRVDAKPSTNNEDKVFNLGILSQENPFEIITRIVQDKNLETSNACLMLEDFDPPLYEPFFFKEVPSILGNLKTHAKGFCPPVFISSASLGNHKLGLPELISTRITLKLANRAICTPAGIARDVFVPVGKFTFPADFVIVDYESDPRVPLILGRPFLRTTRALINVHGEEMILYHGDERLILNMRHDTSSYSNQPQKESINLINVFNNSKIEFLLHQDIDSSLKDSIDQSNLANLANNFVDSVLAMFTDKHDLDSSSPLIFDEYDDDFLEVESDTKNVYDDPFDSNGEKIKEFKLLIDELDLPCDFLPPSEYDSFISQDFSRVDAVSLTVLVKLTSFT